MWNSTYFCSLSPDVHYSIHGYIFRVLWYHTCSLVVGSAVGMYHIIAKRKAGGVSLPRHLFPDKADIPFSKGGSGWVLVR